MKSKQNGSLTLGLLTSCLLISFQNCSGFKPDSISQATSSASSVTTAFMILQNPQSVSVNVGATVNLQVIVQAPSSVVPQYAWYFNQSLLTGPNSPLLSIPDVQSDNAGSYSVVVTAGSQSLTSQPAVITVLAPPSATPTVSPSSTPTPSPSASACVADATIQNFITTAIQYLSGAQSVSSASSAATACYNSAQSIYKLLQNDNWDCTNSSQLVTTLTSCLAEVTNLINAMPSIVSHPSSTTVQIAQTLNLSVTATGTHLSYQWFLNGTALPGGTSSVYSVTADETTAGVYDVQITGTGGSVNSQPAVVTIAPAPGQVVAQMQTANLITPNCNYSPPPQTFVAPTTDTYIVNSFVVAPGNSYFVIPEFQLLDESGNLIADQVLSNNLPNSENTFYVNNSYTAQTTVQLTQGQTYTMTQNYNVRYCVGNKTASIGLGLMQIDYEKVPIEASCVATSQLAAAPSRTAQTPTNSVTSFHQWYCLDGTFTVTFPDAL